MLHWPAPSEAASWVLSSLKGLLLLSLCYAFISQNTQIFLCTEVRKLALSILLDCKLLEKKIARVCVCAYI